MKTKPKPISTKLQSVLGLFRRPEHRITATGVSELLGDGMMPNDARYRLNKLVALGLLGKEAEDFRFVYFKTKSK